MFAEEARVPSGDRRSRFVHLAAAATIGIVDKRSRCEGDASSPAPDEASRIRVSGRFREDCSCHERRYRCRRSATTPISDSVRSGIAISGPLHPKPRQLIKNRTVHIRTGIWGPAALSRCPSLPVRADRAAARIMCDGRPGIRPDPKTGTSPILGSRSGASAGLIRVAHPGRRGYGRP